jgi:hypothetical protein
MGRRHRLAGLLALAVLACPALAYAQIPYLTDIGSVYAGPATTISVATTGAVASGGRLVLVSFTTGAASSPTGMGACTLDGVTPSQTNGVSVVTIFSWVCPSGLASSTTIGLTGGVNGAQFMWAFSTPATISVQDVTAGGVSSAPDTHPTFTTGTFAYSSEVLIEATGLFGGQIVETTSAGCTSHGDTPNGPPALNDLWVSECPISSTSAYTFTSTFASARNWVAVGSSFKIGAVTPATGQSRSLLGVGK